MAEPAPDFADIAVALQLAARDALLARQRDEYTAVGIGLFPATVAHLVEGRQRQVDLIALAHLYFKALIPVETEVKALIAKRSAA